MLKTAYFLIPFLVSSLWGQTATPSSLLDPGLAEYKSISGLSGRLSMVGSDSMETVVQSWITAFKKHQPGCNISYLGRTSDAAATTLAEGGSTVVGMLREMNRAEQDAFLAKWNYQPTRIWVTVNPIAVFVNSGNPIVSLSLDELDAIYSTTRKAGAKASIETWGDLGLMREWANRRITPYCREEGAATRAFFQNRVMLKGEYKPSVVSLQDHTAMLEIPVVDINGIVFTSLDDPVPGTRIVPLAQAGGGKACLPTPENVLKGNYPLVRFFYFYVNKPPTKALPQMVQAFLQFILSREGQQIALNEHQIPVSAEIAKMGLTRIQ